MDFAALFPFPFLTLFLSFLFILLLRCAGTSGTTGNTTGNHCPYPNPILGNLIPFLIIRHQFLDWASSLLSSSPTATIEVVTPFSLSHGIATANPLLVNHFLISNSHTCYVKGSRLRAALSDLLGDGLFIADGDLWALQRKIASREFTTRSLKTFSCDVFKAHVHDRLLHVLSDLAILNKVIDLQDVLKRFAFDNICTVSVGHDPDCLSLGQNGERRKVFFDAFDDAIEISFNRLLSPVAFLWRAMRVLNIGSERRLREAIKTIDEFAMEVIRSKYKDDNLLISKKQDLLSRFMAAIEERDSVSSYNEPRRHVQRSERKKQIFEGCDCLTWFFWLLSQNPQIESKIHEEIRYINENCDYEELKGSHYLHAAIAESLRLFPPVPINSRVVQWDDVLPDGSRVRAGWFADYSAYAMGRDERIWGIDANKSVPDRWLDDKGRFVGADSCKFPAFHAGPRACLGKEMAYVQMKAVVAAVLKRFRLVPVCGGGNEPPGYEMAVTLRMKGGLPVRVIKREK